MRPLFADGHSSLVHAAVQGDSQGRSVVEGKILASWTRCVEHHALDPGRRPEPVVVNRDDLRDRQEKSCQLLNIAQAEMTNLYQQVAGSGYSILLTDCDGVVLNYVGDPLFTATAASSGLQAGAVWSEAAQGTNGMGTCLVEKHPLVIHHDQHFFAEHTRLTCSAAPIFDPQGDMIAVLDASSESRLAQQHTMVLVNMSAQLIENRLFFCGMRDNFVLRFHARPEFLGTLGEGAVAFDAEGRIKAANRSALFQLDLDSIDAIVGRSLEDVFAIRTRAALAQVRDGAGRPMPLRDTRHGRRFFASFQAPAETPSPARPRATPAGDRLQGLEFGDARMQQNIARARKLLEKDIPFMILGETGTGKDVFAKALHAASSRRDKPFVAVNCASLPESLIESELFGYRPGAFTGASKEGARGKILQADGGTLFLDEIGDMPLHLQARLLRVLEEREVVPLGSETSVAVDIRLVSATHRDLRQRVEEGSFREDLYYRLHGIGLTLPPLRDREDRSELICELLKLEAGEQPLALTDDALQAMADYHWPGNIRQLRNVLRTLVGLCEGEHIGLDDLPEEIFTPGDDAREAKNPRPNNALAVAERDALIRELEAAHWNVSRVASKLDISRNTLYRKMKLYGIRPPR